VHASQGSAIAEEAIRRIAELYAVEKQARGKSPEERVALRREHARQPFDDLEAWLHAQLPKISGKSPLAQAIRYALGRLPKARPYLENGCLELDNNTAERAMKPIAPLGHVNMPCRAVIGRKTGCSQAPKAAEKQWQSHSPWLKPPS